MNFDKLATDEVIFKTINALKANGMEAEVAATGEEAKRRALEIIPEGAEVMNMTSVTLDSITLGHELKESGKFKSVRKQLESMDRNKEHQQMNRIGAAPTWAVGSVHAITETGQVVIASNTGSQLPAYVYGAPHVLWIVGTQKIVANLDEAMKRIYDYILPLESERLNKQYRITSGSYVSKLLIINREFVPGRIKIIFVNKILGF